MVKVAIVTGANSGIGLETSRRLCLIGYEVILACRNEDRAKLALEDILKDKPDAAVSFLQLDLSDLSSVRRFVDAFHSLGKSLNILINNGGIVNYGPQKHFTADNFEQTMGTNHLGHFLLTNLLLDDLKAAATDSGEARVIVLTSGMHFRKNGHRRTPFDPLEPGNFFLSRPNSYDSGQAYKNSKLANVLFTYHLAKLLDGTGVTVNCICPGFIPSTGLARNLSFPMKMVFKYLLRPIVFLTGTSSTLSQGADAVMDLAVSEELAGITGKYLQYKRQKESSDESYDEDLQKDVWELSARYCHLEGYEPLDAPAPPSEQAPELISASAEKNDAVQENANKS